MKRKPSLFASTAAVIALGAACAGLGLGLWLGGERLLAELARRRATALMQKGFRVLAADELDPYRHALTRSDAGCDTLITAYFKAERAERMEWASEACIDRGHDLVPARVGLALAAEARGQDAEALQLLIDAASKFRDSPDIYYRLGQLLKKQKRDAEAAQALTHASELAPANRQLALETLQYLVQLKLWPDALKIADRLRAAKTDNPAVKLLIARALLHGGDQGSGNEAVAEAKSLLKRNPALEASLRAEYGDLLGGRGRAKD